MLWITGSRAQIDLIHFVSQALEFNFHAHQDCQQRIAWVLARIELGGLIVEWLTGQRNQREVLRSELINGIQPVGYDLFIFFIACRKMFIHTIERLIVCDST